MSEEKILTDKVFKVTIQGDVWNVYLISEDDIGILEDGDYAETDFGKKELYFRTTTMQIVRHELVHVFVYYTYTDTADLTALQSEELMCEVISWNWDKVSELSAIIFDGLKRLKDE